MNSVTQNILFTQIPKVFCMGPKLWPNYCNFWFLPKFGCHGDVICSLKNSGSIFEFANRENSILRAKNVSLPCTELKYVQFLHIFVYIWSSWQRAVCFIENSDSIRLFADPKTLLFTVKISRFLAQNWNQCNFGWRLLKFGCHMVTLRSLKISDNICEFADS